MKIRTMDEIVSDHLTRYPAAPRPPESATWWALARHEDRQYEAGKAAYASLADSTRDAQWLAQEANLPDLPGEDRHRHEHDRVWKEYSLSMQPGWDRAREVEAAARAAVPFVDEAEPADYAGLRVGLSKGCGAAAAPAGAIARRGGGECSYVAFYDRHGTMISAYFVRHRASESWVENASTEAVLKHFATYRYPIQALAKTSAERRTAAVFGGA